VQITLKILLLLLNRLLRDRQLVSKIRMKQEEDYRIQMPEIRPLQREALVEIRGLEKEISWQLPTD
jgi:hypothetical protein